MIRCEVSDTGTLLARVNDIPGATGYAQIPDAATHPNVETIKLTAGIPPPEMCILRSQDYTHAWTAASLC